MAEQLPAMLVEPKKPMIRLFRYLVPYRMAFAWASWNSILNKVLDLMPPLLVGWITDSVSGHPPTWMTALFNTDDPKVMATLLAVLAVVIFGFESFFEWLYHLGFMRMAQRVQHDLRMDAYNQLQQREFAFFEEHRTGETMSMLNDDINQLERFLNTGFNELLQLLVLFVFAGIVMVGTSPVLALIALAPIPLIVGGSLLYQRKIAPRYRRMREAVGALTSRLENNLGGIQVIKSFTAEKFESARVREASMEYRDANFSAIKLAAVYIPLIRMGVAIGFGAVLLVGSLWILRGEDLLTVGELVLFGMMTQRILWPLTRLGQTLDEYERAKASARRTFALVDTPAAVRDPAEPTKLDRAQGTINFDQVDFTYRRGVPVLKSLSFEAAAGETIGIAGPTGAGKSTLVKLLLRMYDVNGGCISIDGIDLRDMTLNDIRRNVALVSQDVYLFHGTIAENIAYGMDQVTREQIQHAAQMAHMDDFVESLPDGFDTIVGERGIKLSGGQRQRLSIARAVLKAAPILVLDEATSSVDTETEREIQQNLSKLTEGRTALVIAHRLSTIRNADRIVVLRDGQVTEQGQHEDLLALNGTYADLWHIQSGQA